MKILASPIRRRLFLAGLAVAAPVLGLIAQSQYGGSPIWWEAGTGEKLPLSAAFPDATGDILVYNTDGELNTRGHAFFTQMGANDRACVTCHQPSNAMSVSTDRLNERWEQTHGSDAVFAAIDGANCPSLPQKEKSSHSLLLQYGLFRIAKPWPAPGIKPEFTIEVVRDASGCNLDPVYGIKSANPTVSVFRRPRMVGNFKYLNAKAFTADDRAATLEEQAQDAVRAHEQGMHPLTAEQLKQIVDFERQIYVAQSRDDLGGDLTEVGGPQSLGPWNLGRGKVAPPNELGHFLAVQAWPRYGASETPEAKFRASVLRGSVVFSQHTFHINDAAGLDKITGHRTIDGTCATCHAEPMTGAAKAGAIADIGTTSLPWADDRPELPLFKITCSKTATPHPYLGRVIFTNDPGRALVTGKCADVGSVVLQQLRGLPARAPYFTAGGAKDLREVVNYYDRRFHPGYTDQEKQDLVNFLSVL